MSVNLELLHNIKNKHWQERLDYIANKFAGRGIFSTSFSIEDQVITHHIARHNLAIDIFTLDTGRMFDETYEVWQNTKDKYNIDIKPYYPDSAKLKEYVETKGINAFYQSKDLRLSCCAIRKTEPLKRALKGYDIWLSGLRIAQSIGREDKELFEEDGNLGITKLYPILELTDANLWEFIKSEDIPYNRLYEKGFTSIGCAPCSRPPTDPNDPRSGRWWWETDSQKECGLHIVDGKLVRKK